MEESSVGGSWTLVDYDGTNGVNETIYDDDASQDCAYFGTEHLQTKIWLIGVFGVSICILSVIFNSFFSIVFWRNSAIRKTGVYYFGILAFIDILMAINYVMVMAVPVFFDYFEYLPMYHLYLSYFRLMLTETAMAMFASMLLILLATTERLLRTFHSRNVIRVRKNVMAEQFNVLAVLMHNAQAPYYVRKTRQARKFLEQNRPMVCMMCLSIAILYKCCHYFEIQYVEKANCTDFSQFEIAPTTLSSDKYYNFWWMFVTRNVVDRISPFFILVIMNILIIKALKKEYKKLASEPKSLAEENTTKRTLSSKPSRSSLRDATRALISVVTTYLISQSLQVLLTFWEVIDRPSLEGEYIIAYSYMNDLVSILPLLASCLRFPIYCSCNNSIYDASKEMIKHWMACLHLAPPYYFPIGKGAPKTPGDTPPQLPTLIMRIDDKPAKELNGKASAALAAVECAMAHSASGEILTDDSEQEWQL